MAPGALALFSTVFFGAMAVIAARSTRFPAEDPRRVRWLLSGVAAGLVGSVVLLTAAATAL